MGAGRLDNIAIGGENLNARHSGKVAIIGCPKLDDAAAYREKLAKIIQANHIEFIHVVYMEVPCCGGLVRLVQQAVADSGCKVPVKLTKIGIGGEIKDESVL